MLAKNNFCSADQNIVPFGDSKINLWYVSPEVVTLQKKICIDCGSFQTDRDCKGRRSNFDIQWFIDFCIMPERRKPFELLAGMQKTEEPALPVLLLFKRVGYAYLLHMCRIQRCRRALRLCNFCIDFIRDLYKFIYRRMTLSIEANTRNGPKGICPANWQIRHGQYVFKATQDGKVYLILLSIECVY